MVQSRLLLLVCAAGARWSVCLGVVVVRQAWCGRRAALVGGAMGLATPAAATTESTRSRLLQAVATSPEAVDELIEELSSSPPPRAADASGRWELVWSARTSKFSPLLDLPPPLRPLSEQRIQGGGTIENTLREGLLGPFEFVLRAGAADRGDDTIEILPPFTFQVRRGHSVLTIIDADSDAEFRRTQARSRKEQEAGRNMYKLIYLETSGRPGDLRLSRVVAGDPVIVGATFLHRRI